ncbi:MAG: hypothetical protein HY656_08540, partial [Acidobacteria bacterium]|nr:hypothetical protein [Acidobacteriota bacterium]
MTIPSTRQRRKDCGVVLLLALVALLLISAVGAAILFMTATESSLVGYQRTTTRAHEGGLGGLEEGRSRLSTSDPNYFGGLTLTLLFPQRVGDVLYITNPGVGDNVQPWTPGNDFYDREYVTEWGAAIETIAACGGDPFAVAPAAPCGWAVPSDQAPMAAAGLVLPELPYKWVRITILTEQAANRDINGDGGALDPAIPVTWDSRTNRMNILVDPTAQVDREGDGIPAPLDTDLDGTVEREERLGRYVYRITTLSRVRSAVVGGAVQYAIRLVQYDVSSPFVNLDFPGAVSLIGLGSTCGQNMSPPAPPDGNAQGWGPTEAADSRGNDQAPGAAPNEGGPSIG